MRKVKYKDKDREFEMPSDTFLEAFPERVMLELIKTHKPKNMFSKFWNYLKTIPLIARLLSWLGMEFLN